MPVPNRATIGNTADPPPTTEHGTNRAMWPWSLLPIAAAADPRLENVTRSLQLHRQQNDVGDAIMLLAGLLAAVILLWLIARWTGRPANSDSPWRLFRSLAKAHELGWLDCWFLWRIARAKAGADPSLVFLDPSLTAAEGLKLNRLRDAERLEAIRARVFAGLEQADPGLC